MYVDGYQPRRHEGHEDARSKLVQKIFFVRLRVLRVFVALKAYRDTSLSQVLLKRPNTGLGVVEDRRRQGRVGAAGGEHFTEVVECPGAAGRDDWNRHRLRHRGREPAVEADLRAVAVDRGQ